MGFLETGPLELLVIFIVTLLVFGPERLPEVFGKVGAFVRQVRQLSDTVSRDVRQQLNIDDALRGVNNPNGYRYSAPPPPPISQPIDQPSSPITPSYPEKAPEPIVSPAPDPSPRPHVLGSPTNGYPPIVTNRTFATHGFRGFRDDWPIAREDELISPMGVAGRGAFVDDLIRPIGEAPPAHANGLSDRSH
ncbi:MAG: twin-arginine translocase TatA/TatE family subunit, partial [Dehalococcoidia bacterium]|nr:twin-arginine translocase TatA/TatE family subunit [Dehalococcoidia bacterium]